MLLDQHFPGCSSSPDIGELVQALCRAQMQFTQIRRSAKYELGDRSYRYSTWADICHAMYPALHGQGIVFLARSSKSGESWVMVGTLCHGPSGQWITSTCPIRDVVDSYGVRGDSQSYEIATTYAKKTLLKSLAGGFEEGDETAEQDAAIADASSMEDERYESVRLRCEAGLKQFSGNTKKTKAAFTRMDELVASGELRQGDCDALKKRFALPQQEEVCVAN